MGAIDRLNEAPLTSDLFKDLLELLGDLPPEDRHDEVARSLAMITFLKDAKIDGDHAHILSAVHFRMAALSRLRNEPAFAAWSIKPGKADGPDLLHETLVETAAIHPLVDVDENPAFDPESFFRAALERSATEGRA